MMATNQNLSHVNFYRAALVGSFQRGNATNLALDDV